VTSLFPRYVAAIRDLFGEGYWATWQPNVRHTLGEIGVVEHGMFVPIDHVRDQGLSVRREKAKARDVVTYRSDDAIRVTLKSAGEAGAGLLALTAAEAGAVVEFGREGGIVFDLSGVEECRLAKQEELAKHVLGKWREGLWPEDRVIVTHLLEAQSGTILAAAGSGAKAELRLRAGLPKDVLPVDANLSAGFEIAHSEALSVRVGGTGLTPVFRVLRLKKTWLGRIRTVYGTVQPFRTGELTDDAFEDLMAEAEEEPEVVLGAADQLEFIDDQPGRHDA
jgi:hypothetical protein